MSGGSEILVFVDLPAEGPTRLKDTHARPMELREGSPRTLEQLGFWHLHLFKTNTPLYLLDRPLDRRCATRGSRRRATAGGKRASRGVPAAGCATRVTRRMKRPGVPCRWCSTARTGAAGECRPRMRRPWVQSPASACRRPPATGVLAGPPRRRRAGLVAYVLPIPIVMK